MHRYTGCLLGGAIGDALGWPVEFLRYSEIIERYGELGVTGLRLGSSGRAEITDDTQMTIFTAEGLLRAFAAVEGRGKAAIPGFVYKSYLRWMLTQGENVSYGDINNGWLMGIRDLYHVRAPGITCMSALRSGSMGTMELPLNNSKGCGGIMRAAPVGLVMGRGGAFKTGAEIAAITHGHPSGYLAAGVLAEMVRCIVDGMDLMDSVGMAMDELRKYKDHEECLQAVEKAIDLTGEGNPGVDRVSDLGAGWVAEEALAIAIYCSLAYKDDFRKALLLSVNHSGDSDSTGAITGNILGAYLGIQRIPGEWADRVELSAELKKLAGDLYVRYRDDEVWRSRYPVR